MASCQAGVYGELGVVVPRRPRRPAGPARRHAVLRQQQVEDGGDQVAADAAYRHAAREVGGRAVGGVEARHPDDDRLGGGARAGRATGSTSPRSRFHLPDAGLAVAVAQGAVRDDGLAGPRVDEHGLERGVLLARVVGEVGGGEELAGRVLARRRASSRRTRWGRSV